MSGEKALKRAADSLPIQTSRLQQPGVMYESDPAAVCFVEKEVTAEHKVCRRSTVRKPKQHDKNGPSSSKLVERLPTGTDLSKTKLALVHFHSFVAHMDLRVVHSQIRELREHLGLLASKSGVHQSCLAVFARHTDPAAITVVPLNRKWLYHCAGNCK